MDLLLTRYGQCEMIGRMPYKKAAKLIARAKSEIQKEKRWAAYLSIYPWMQKDDFITFEDFEKEANDPAEKVDASEILTNVRDIISLTNAGKRVN